MKQFDETECNRRHDFLEDDVKQIWGELSTVKGYFITILGGVALTLLSTVGAMILVYIK